VLIENRPGGGAVLGMSAVARARPDGYTLAQMILPGMRLPFMQRMSFNPRTDFTPVMHVTGYTFGVLVKADSPWKTYADLVAEMKRRPGQIRWGNTGANGTPHLTNVDLAERDKVEVIHVPFRGEADATPALLGGHIEAASTGTGSGELVQQGSLRFLNFWTRERVKRFPTVPTLLELGYQGMVVTSPYGIVGPAGMEPGLVAALHDGFKRAQFDPAHLATLDRLDQPNEYLNSADYARFMAQTIDLEEARVKRLGLSSGG
jgi:tripartite-type tricarboxylate transporter receptor subunit TctC